MYFFFLISLLTSTTAVEIKVILALFALFLFRKAIVKARSGRLRKVTNVPDEQAKQASFCFCLARLQSSGSESSDVGISTYPTLV